MAPLPLDLPSLSPTKRGDILLAAWFFSPDFVRNTIRNRSQAVPFLDQGPARLYQSRTELVWGLHCLGPAPERDNWPLRPGSVNPESGLSILKVAGPPL